MGDSALDRSRTAARHLACLAPAMIITGTLFANWTDAPLQLASLFALMANGNFVLVALVGIAIPRYTLAMWPALVLFAFYLAWALRDAIKVPTKRGEHHGDRRC